MRLISGVHGPSRDTIPPTPSPGAAPMNRRWWARLRTAIQPSPPLGAPAPITFASAASARGSQCVISNER
jgi:hypothetical protein